MLVCFAYQDKALFINNPYVGSSVAELYMLNQNMSLAKYFFRHSASGCMFDIYKYIFQDFKCLEMHSSTINNSRFVIPLNFIQN